MAEFSNFVGITIPTDLRFVTRAHVIVWRKDMEKRELSPATIRRKLSALSSLYDYLCDHNAVLGNPVDGVKRPLANGNEGSTPALGDKQVRTLLEAPSSTTLKGVRDRAILATLLYHGLRRAELCDLKVKDLHSRQGVLHLRVLGKRSKIRYVPVHPAAMRLIEDYLFQSGHALESNSSLFRPIKNPKGDGNIEGHLNPASVYRNVVRKYAVLTGVDAEVHGLCVHSMRTTAATNALGHDSDIAKVQDWLGHANISTTRLYDRRKNRPEDSPTFRIKY